MRIVKKLVSKKRCIIEGKNFIEYKYDDGTTIYHMVYEPIIEKAFIKSNEHQKNY